MGESAVVADEINMNDCVSIPEDRQNANGNDLEKIQYGHMPPPPPPPPPVEIPHQSYSNEELRSQTIVQQPNLPQQNYGNVHMNKYYEDQTNGGPYSFSPHLEGMTSNNNIKNNNRSWQDESNRNLDHQSSPHHPGYKEPIKNKTQYLQHGEQVENLNVHIRQQTTAFEQDNMWGITRRTSVKYYENNPNKNNEASPPPPPPDTL